MDNKKLQTPQVNKAKEIEPDIVMPYSTRFKLSIFSTIILTIVGMLAYVYNPENIDKFAFYTINMVLPIVSYVIGRTIKSGKHEKGIITHAGLRYRTAMVSFLLSLVIGIVCYIFSPENIDKLGMYMIGVILPIVGFILGQSFRKSERRMYEHDYDGYGDYYSGYGNNRDYSGGNYSSGHYGHYGDGYDHGTHSYDSGDYGPDDKTADDYGGTEDH